MTLLSTVCRFLIPAKQDGYLPGSTLSNVANFMELKRFAVRRGAWRLLCFIIQIVRPGHFSDRTFFVTPAVTRFSSLLSVINIDSLIVCLQVTHLSFILLLCSGKLPLRRRLKSRNGKPSRFFTHVFLARNFKLSYNESTERSCQSESEARICTEILTGTQ